jgi:hypothetical protein
MARSRSSIGLFGIFGRSDDLRALDGALHAVDLHPRVVPEAVKLATVNLLKDDAPSGTPAPQAYPAAAEILAYCMLGPEAFARANGPDLTGLTERRIERAAAAGEGLDARIVLLAIHARVIQPAVTERFGLEADEA